jgi:short-subunit dehydrogenase
LIAGGSEGLGHAFAAEAAARGLHVVIVARRPEPLATSADRLRADYPVQVREVVADLSQPSAFHDVLPAATGELEIGLVVANAAHAPVGPFLGLAAGQARQAIQVNCAGPVRLAADYLPAMVRRRRGGLIVVSSLAGLQSLPGGAVYAATKAFGRVLAESLWAELRPHGVDVLACVAGAIRTPGWDRSGMRSAPGILHSARVAADTYDRLGHGPIVIPGRFNRAATAALRLLPRRTAITIMDRATARLSPTAVPDERADP